MILDYPGGPNLITGVLKSREPFRAGLGRELSAEEAPGRRSVAGFEDRGKGHKPRNMDLWKLKKVRKWGRLGGSVQLSGCFQLGS